MDIDNIKYRLWDDCTKKMYPIIGFDLKGGLVITDYEGRGAGRVIIFDSTDQDVMRFSGLIDEKGVDIYERDIIITTGFVAAVVFKFGSFGIIPREGMFLSFQSNPYLDKSSCKIDECEVVGNIYENPEIEQTQVEI